MNEHVLTIAIPTFNSEGYLKKSLYSIVSQYCDGVEVIVMDNASTDGTHEAVAKYQERYPQIQYYRNECNIGPDGNFLRCYRVASGKYVMLLSDDDILIENSLKYIVEFLSLHEDMSLIYLNTYDFFEEYICLENCRQNKNRTVQLENDLCTYDKNKFMRSAGHQLGFISSYVVARDCFLKIENPEQYMYTNWFQGYIHVLSSKCNDKKLGIIGRPVIAAGRYGKRVSFDMFTVYGSNLKKLYITAAQQAGYGHKLMMRLYGRTNVEVLAKAVIRRKAAKQPVTVKNFKMVFSLCKKYPKAWLMLFPTFLIPQNICSLLVNIAYSKFLHRSEELPSREEL